MNTDNKEALLTVCRYICDCLIPHLSQTEEEITNLLRGLSGQFILPSAAGAPTNGRTDVLPTGRNFYGVDPQTLPTKTAWEVGKKRANGVIEQYIADEGHYPKTIGMVMGSDMRTHGVSFAHYLNFPKSDTKSKDLRKYIEKNSPGQNPFNQIKYTFTKLSFSRGSKHKCHCADKGNYKCLHQKIFH